MYRERTFTDNPRYVHSYPIIPRKHLGIKRTQTPVRHSEAFLHYSLVKFPLPLFFPSQSKAQFLCSILFSALLPLSDHTCAWCTLLLNISLLESGKHDLHTRSTQCNTLIRGKCKTGGCENMWAPEAECRAYSGLSCIRLSHTWTLCYHLGAFMFPEQPRAKGFLYWHSLLLAPLVLSNQFKFLPFI